MRHALLVFLFLAASAARADPCEAIPENGPLPAYLSSGATFSGPVVHVIDGDGLCVAMGEGPKNWVEVRAAGFYAPETGAPEGPAAKAAMTRVALGKTATCVADRQTHDRIAARCTIGGRDLGDLMREAGVTEAGNGLKVARPPSLPHLGSGAASARPAALPRAGRRFKSCAEAHAAGVAPLRRGRPGYNPRWDGDGDGLACEPLPRRPAKTLH